MREGESRQGEQGHGAMHENPSEGDAKGNSNFSSRPAECRQCSPLKYSPDKKRRSDTATYLALQSRLSTINVLLW
jgi:hypothetical protein